MKCHSFLIWLALLLAAPAALAQEQELSPRAQFSVLTCGPGTDLYATFGHSSFRLRDPALGIDRVYNYGTFDFHTPNFYMKFARGKLPYALSKQKFENFLYTYQLEHRWVREQLLDLTPAESQSLLAFLEANHRPENRYYHYDFLFENCATKIPEVLKEVLGDGLTYSYDHLQQPYTFRDLIQKNLHPNSWSSFGIDLALGSVIDREARGPEYAFLPEYVESQIGHARLGEAPLVSRERVILDLDPPEPLSYFTATPLFWGLILLGITLVITWIDFRNATRSRILDFVLFFLTGVSGLVIAFLWFLTDHNATAWNANLLWAMPLNIIPAFWLLFPAPRARMLRRYLPGLLLLIGVMLLFWISKVQIFSPILIPVLTALTIRYAYLIKYYKPAL
ncbi:MAG: DUF4105 domain-containing protein [Robiginitalea sp.]